MGTLGSWTTPLVMTAMVTSASIAVMTTFAPRVPVGRGGFIAASRIQCGVDTDRGHMTFEAVATMSMMATVGESGAEESDAEREEYDGLDLSSGVQMSHRYGPSAAGSKGSG